MQPPQTAAAFDPTVTAAALREEALRLGFSRIGITDLTAPPHHAHFQEWLARGFAGAMGEWLERHEPLRRSAESVLEGVRSVVMLATDHATAAPAVGQVPGQGRGRVARYAWGDDYHDILRDRSNRLGAWLEARVPGCRTRGVVDSAPIAERDFARLAGLGWVGKNTMLIDPGAGSYFLLTALLTDLALPASVPIQTDHCGTCTACLDACPTGALVEPRLLDANRCISGLTIEQRGPIAADLRVGMGDWVFGCDVCQEVCPWNRHSPGSTEPMFQARGGETTLSLAGILRMDKREFRGRFAGTALLRPKRGGLLRSAAIALGNHPHPPSFESLAAALDDDEPVVRGAAAWALGRWISAGVLEAECRTALARRREIETDAEVAAEIATGETLGVSAGGPSGQTS